MTLDQLPASVLLNSLLTALHYVPAGALRVKSEIELPLNLRARIRSSADDAWQAWAYGPRWWFATAHRLHSSAEPSVVAEFFDADGRCVAAGVWRRHHERWVLETPA